MNSWKNSTDHLFNHITTIKFLNPDFVGFVLHSFFHIVPSNITMCQILQLSLATLISNDYLKEQRK